MKARFALMPQVNTAGLVGHWKFWEGTAFDYSLRGHSGTLTGTTLTYKYPGLDLAGNDEHIVIADHDDFSFGDSLTDSPFSISVWIKSISGDMPIFVKYDTGLQEYELMTVSGKLILRLYDDAAPGDPTRSIGRKYQTALPTGTWMHIVSTYDGSGLVTGIKLYVDAQRVDNANDSNSGSYVAMENMATPVWIGKVETSFYGEQVVDNVMIFNTEKSASEAKSIFEMTRKRYGV